MVIIIICVIIMIRYERNTASILKNGMIESVVIGAFIGLLISLALPAKMVEKTESYYISLPKNEDLYFVPNDKVQYLFIKQTKTGLSFCNYECNIVTKHKIKGHAKVVEVISTMDENSYWNCYFALDEKSIVKCDVYLPENCTEINFE